MTSVEERMKILKMIEEGKISAEEGAKLLAALAEGRRGSLGPTQSRGPGAPRTLRIRVTDIGTGRSKASVQIPLGISGCRDEDRRAFCPGSGRRGHVECDGRHALWRDWQDHRCGR